MKTISFTNIHGLAEAVRSWYASTQGLDGRISKVVDAKPLIQANRELDTTTIEDINYTLQEMIYRET